jgi:polyisoprenoid-binding protein YceI
MQPKESKLTFVGEQAGAKFEGSFDKFSADIRFDAKDLATSRFDVKIDTASVNTQDGERDDTIKSADLFDVKRFPSAHYVAEKFTDKGGNKYSATGKLTLRNVTKDVPIEFTFENKDGGAWLKGTAKIKRLDFGVGQGEWKDTSTVGNDVQVRFALRLKGAS